MRAGSALGFLVIATAQASAGALAVHEQSAFGQGASWAGVAAGGSLSTMFWNPAVMTQFAGVQSASSYTGFYPNVKNSPAAGSTYFGSALPTIVQGPTNNTFQAALIPAGYFSYQLNPNLWLGMSLNSPFGLSVGFPENWVGRDYAAGDSWLHTYNAAPSIAYQFNNWISVGVGVQIQYAKASVNQGVSVFSPLAQQRVPFGDKNLSGDGWGYGFTVGLTLTPTPTTMIGIGYRSGINQKINGTVTAPAVGGISVNAAETTVNLPGVLSAGIRQKIDPQWTLLGTIEWTNWNRIGTSNVLINGATAGTLPFQYQDSWLFSIGAEYQASDRLALRAGFGYETAAISDQVRIPLIPDSTRYWASVGASYVIIKGLKADLAYSHVFEPDASVNISATSGNPWFAGSVTAFNPAGIAYIGNASTHADIISIGLNWKWDDVFK